MEGVVWKDEMPSDTALTKITLADVGPVYLESELFLSALNVSLSKFPVSMASCNPWKAVAQGHYQHQRQKYLNPDLVGRFN
jgi:hypothetical protein